MLNIEYDSEKQYIENDITYSKSTSRHMSK